jgi:hypothetical protein
LPPPGGVVTVCLRHGVREPDQILRVLE